MAVFEDPDEQLKQYKRLRRDVGADDTVLDDPLAEEYFVEAQEVYPANTRKMIAYARVVALKGIRASAALLGKYAMNQHEEDFTKVFDNLGVLLEDAKTEVEQVTDAVDEENFTPFFFEAAHGQRGR